MRWLLFFSFVFTIFTVPAHGAEWRCNTIDAVVIADDEGDSRLACAGAFDAVTFLEELGFDVNVPLHIEVLDTVVMEVEDDPSFRILGQYKPETNRVLVTSTAGQRAMAEEKPIFGVPYEPALFRSVVAHEVGHAVAEANFHVESPSRLAHEYIAYIVQFATMPARLRESILDHNRAPAFKSELEINPLIYGLDPDAFAIKAYRHYHSAAGGPGFLDHLLQRDLLTMFPLWGRHASKDPLDQE